MYRLIDREKLIAEYDRVHVGPPGGARKLMEEADEVPAIKLEWIGEYLAWLESMICYVLTLMGEKVEE